MLKVRRFTEQGVAAVKAAFDIHLSGMTKGVHGIPIQEADLQQLMALADDEDLLEADELSVSIDPSIRFGSSLDLGKHLCKQFEHMEFDARSSGIWTWLAVVYLDQLLERDKEGQPRLLSSYRYVLDDNNRLRYYRHLIFMPYYLSLRLGDDAYVFLHSPLYVSGEFLAQAQKDEVVSNKNLVSMCEKYFFDRKTGKFSPGFTSAKAGEYRSIRRLVQSIVPQLNINYDMHTCGPDHIFELLPSDFRENSFPVK